MRNHTPAERDGLVDEVHKQCSRVADPGPRRESGVSPCGTTPRHRYSAASPVETSTVRASGMKAGSDSWVAGLLAWYGRNRRPFPWRERPAPYRVWVSEIMLQQTRAATVEPYYERFLSRFPTVHVLAESAREDVLKAWEGLGYYSRARNLHAAAGRVVQMGGFPDDLDGWLSLPGVGPYTAAAVVSIVYGLPHPVVDGNVLRVFSRFRGLGADISLAGTKHRFREQLGGVIRACSSPGDFNQAMMELGALVCRPRRAVCAACPLAAECVALARDRVAVLPAGKPRRTVPHQRVVVGLVRRGDTVLIARRGERQMLAGLWEFPGGKVEPGETLQEALVREVREETGLSVSVGAEICTIEHAYSHFTMTLTAFWCDLLMDSEPLSCPRPSVWVRLPELRRYPFPGANRKIFTALGL